MIFVVNLIYSMLCSYGFSRLYNLKNENKLLSYYILLFPIWSIWLAICGGQYDVGTDYFTYYDIFKNIDVDLYINKGEYFFAWIVIIANKLAVPVQSIFFIFYFVGFSFFILIILKLDQKTCFIYVFLYITLSNLFHNQLNELRQAIAIYICTYAVWLLDKDKKIRFLLLIYIASLFHSSALFMLTLFLFLYKKYQSISVIQCYLLLAVSSFFSLFGTFSWIFSLLDNIIPSYYKIYVGGSFDTSNTLLRVLPKLMWIPFYLGSTCVLRDNRLSKSDIFLYKVGFISYALRLFFLGNIIFTRIGNLFVLLSIFPIYFYLKYLYEYRTKNMFLIISFCFLIFYLLKVLLFPIDEYVYQSIYSLSLK